MTFVITSYSIHYTKLYDAVDPSSGVVYEPVKLTQEFRNFDNLSPWQGPDLARVREVLPGDEKAEKKG